MGVSLPVVGMRALDVVKIDPLPDSSTGFGARFENFQLDTFIFE